MMKSLVRIILIAAIVSVFAAGYLIAWPAPIDPGSWNPPQAPALEGPYAMNSLLAATVRLGEGDGEAPEDIAVDLEGRIFGGFVDGRIARWDKDGKNPEIVADTGGRPLGLHFDKDGRLIVADVKKGLLAMSPEGELTTLTTTHGDRPFGFTDDVDIASDGVIYFSDASDKFDHTQYIMDLLEHRPNGRLLSYDPATQETALLADGLYFANGVAVDVRQEFVLVVETGKYRILRYWLTPERRGEIDVFVDNLPGFPDGVSAGSRDIFWVAIATPRDALLDDLLPRPFWRKVIARLPAFLRPGVQRHSFVLGINREGEVVYNLQDPDGVYSPITSVQEANNFLYFGSIVEEAFGRFPRPE